MPQTRTTNGPIHAVICPHCGHPNDFRDLNSQQLLDTGHTMFCDRCRRVMEVSRIAQVVVVTVRQAGRNHAAPRTLLPAARPARQATTLSPAATRRLLRGK